MVGKCYEESQVCGCELMGMHFRAFGCIGCVCLGYGGSHLCAWIRAGMGWRCGMLCYI
jgi:hypothetical protein